MSDYDRNYYLTNKDRILRQQKINTDWQKHQVGMNGICKTCYNEANAGFCPICKKAACLDCMVSKH